MAVVIDPKDREQFLKYAAEENLEATEVAVVTEDPRLVLCWRGKEIVNISRAFLDTNGAHQENDVFVEIPKAEDTPLKRSGDIADVKEKMAVHPVRPQRMLPEGSCGNVRLLHRRRQRADALRR